MKATGTSKSENNCLGAPGFLPEKRRWNRWHGRIVLVEPPVATPLITVKVHGEPLTLKSPGPVLGLDRAPHTWDTVAIMVDPEKVELVGQTRLDTISQAAMADHVPSIPDRRVWLKGRVEAVRHGKTECLISLEVSDAHVCALIEAEQRFAVGGIVGEWVKIYVGQWDAWLRPQEDDGNPVFCKLTY